MTWQPTPVLVFTREPGRTTVTYVTREPVDLSKLIACVTCRATVTQTCRTRTGHTREPHDTRVAPRLCACGAVPPTGHVMCAPCAAESIRVSKRDYLRRRRAAA